MAIPPVVIQFLAQRRARRLPRDAQRRRHRRVHRARVDVERRAAAKQRIAFVDQGGGALGPPRRGGEREFGAASDRASAKPSKRRSGDPRGGEGRSRAHPHRPTRRRAEERRSGTEVAARWVGKAG